ncbi:hypothetical protein CBR_g51293 [Chara braunii]|uniref:Uncharacterized protein n=1 Tax=Chara braunii TaxID=69332 RepID=A0A388M8B9_CHABU|nr:hypothetical protein CBR_g51293 [Chara braunii]|eukprot:GBG90786.1 hypothetical protein CBR_g51293 [Chara braunii]
MWGLAQTTIIGLSFAELDDEGDLLLARRWLHNERLDDMMAKEDDIAHIENYTNDWQFCTAPGRHRERLLRRRSGHERADHLVEYNVQDRECSLHAQETGDWVEGRCPGGSSRAKGRQQQHAAEVHVAGKRRAEKHLSPPKKKKRGRPRKAAAAAPDVLTSSRLVTKEAMKQAGKWMSAILDDDDCEASSSSSSSSSSPCSPSASSAGDEHHCKGVGSEDEGGEDQGSEAGGDNAVDGGQQ